MVIKSSKNGLNLIKKWETFKAEPYQCAAGVWTIGYGHTRTVDGALTTPISEDTAETLLKQDVYFIEKQLEPLIRELELNQNQYDAIVSFCFNLGVGAFKKSNAFREMLLESTDSKMIADSWITFRNAGGRYLRGLMLRRFDELMLYYG